jgi:hypothetical protein
VLTVEWGLTNDCLAILRIEVFSKESLKEIRVAFTLCDNFFAHLQNVKVPLVVLFHLLSRISVGVHAEIFVGTRHADVLGVVDACSLV